jgi:hypothetical protein
MENLDLEAQLEDLMIYHDDTSDQSTDTSKTGLELSEDDNPIFSSYKGKLDNRCQILAITEDNSEELDENNNPVLNPANINRGANHLVEGETADSLATREKVRLLVDDWRIINAAVEHGTPIPTNSSKNMLLGYHYVLRQQAKQLAKERIEIQKRKDSAIAASDAARRAHSDASYTNRSIIDMDQDIKILSTQIDKASPKTSTLLSYRSTSKETLYQKLLRWHWWHLKHTYIQHDQIQETRGNTCTTQH